ncbi:unnamed protein product, partial [Mycobacterium sp. PO1]
MSLQDAPSTTPGVIPGVQNASSQLGGWLCAGAGVRTDALNAM